MKISDLLIIYFSAGAPVAAYFYLQNRAQPDRIKLWRKTVFTFLFWMPAALRFFGARDFFRNRVFFNRSNKVSPQNEREKNLRRLQKEFEKILTASDCRISVFEFRETLERYVGLTLASKASAGKANEEFFLAAKNKNPALAARCLDRRSGQRLRFHRIDARRDFLQILSRLHARALDAREFAALACEFAKTLEDDEAEKAMQSLFAALSNDSRQSRREAADDEKQFLNIASASQL